MFQIKMGRGLTIIEKIVEKYRKILQSKFENALNILSSKVHTVISSEIL